VLTASFWNAQVRDNFNVLAPIASGAAWTSWSPSLAVGFSNGNATRTGGYLQVGKTVAFWAKIVFGSSTSKGAQMNVTIPVTASLSDSGFFIAAAQDISINTFPVMVLPQSTTQVEIVAINASSTYAAAAQINATVPFTWDTGDIVRYGGFYEAA
jgi:hypothetical protein